MLLLAYPLQFQVPQVFEKNFLIPMIVAALLRKERFLSSSSDDSETHEIVDYENMYDPLVPLRSFTENSENIVIESPIIS